MLFNSYIFIFAFAPITFILYWLLRKLGFFRASLSLLIIASLIFYGYQNPYYALLLIISILVNYGVYRIFASLRKREGSKNIRAFWLGLGIFFNLGILFYFKYLNFFIDNFNHISGQTLSFLKIALPLGISFYTFQQISFIVDAYSGEIDNYSFIEYALFVSFFPQLIAGPIVLHSEMVPQFRASKDVKSPKTENIRKGAEFFIIGLSKKILIADLLGRGVDWGYQNILFLNSFSAVFIILAYTLQIYFDFSGYCDMAIGLGKFFGFDIVGNFDSPYRALSVSEFWKRWHITLTRFFTKYIYIPLGGNRKGKARTCLNVMIVFAISGLWHGADWTFVLWGVLHGALMVIERLLGQKLEKIPKAVRFLYTFGFVNLAWVLFRADNFTDAVNVLKRILHGGKGWILSDILSSMYAPFNGPLFERLGVSVNLMPSLYLVVTVVVLIISVYLCTLHKNSAKLCALEVNGVWYGITLGVLFTVCVLGLSGVSTFLYFNF